jgi:hypothetical protein
MVVFGLLLPYFSFAQATSHSLEVAATPNGSDLALGDSCYTITTTKDGKQQTLGFVFQSLKSEQRNGSDVLRVVVHQHLLSGKFDMRDSLTVRRADLRPLSLDTDRDGAPHVHLDYAAHRVTGWKMVNGAKEPISVAFDGPIWDGNLWGVTFASLPLKAGGSYRLPTYQYDSGKGSFFVTVTGRRKVDTGQGAVNAWVLEAGLNSNERVEYLVSRNPPMELGYNAGPMSQRIGGDCAGLR